MSGLLSLDSAGCVFLQRSDGMRVDLLWPKGSSASRRSDGQLEIRAASGRVIAVTGENFSSVGGAVTAVASNSCVTPSRAFEINQDLS